jgi:2-phospho-L-lactate/phosphoenolpyruvate guanylyltransferase
VITPRSVFGLLPVRRLGDAKGRLGPTLTPAERANLALALLERAAAALFDGGVQRVAVITGDERLVAYQPERRLEMLRQTSDGLNPAIREGQRWALENGAGALLIVLPDLPLVAADDIELLTTLLEHPPAAVIAPDRHGMGTNALLLSPPDLIDPAFGAGSAPRHLAALAAAGVTPPKLHRKGLSLDLDTPDDLARLAALGHDWREYLRPVH